MNVNVRKRSHNILDIYKTSMNDFHPVSAFIVHSYVWYEALCRDMYFDSRCPMIWVWFLFCFALGMCIGFGLCVSAHGLLYVQAYGPVAWGPCRVKGGCSLQRSPGAQGAQAALWGREAACRLCCLHRPPSEPHCRARPGPALCVPGLTHTFTQERGSPSSHVYTGTRLTHVYTGTRLTLITHVYTGTRLALISLEWHRQYTTMFGVIVYLCDVVTRLVGFCLRGCGEVVSLC